MAGIACFDRFGTREFFERISIFSLTLNRNTYLHTALGWPGHTLVNITLHGSTKQLTSGIPFGQTLRDSDLISIPRKKENSELSPLARA